MSIGKRMIKIFGLISLLSLLSACSNDVTAVTEDSSDMNQLYHENFLITEADSNTDYTNPIYIDLSSADEELVLKEAGDYVLSGKGENTVCIDAQDQMVHLFLDNIDLQTVSGPAINVISASKVIITINSDTENTIADSAYYANTEEANAAIYSTCDLTINGTGMLNVFGYNKDAIHTKDLCKILDGVLKISAKRSGVRGNDGIMLSPEILYIESETYGLQTTKADQDSRGVIEISKGITSILAGRYAIQAASDVYVRNCELSMNSVITNINTEGDMYIEEGIMFDKSVSP